MSQRVRQALVVCVCVGAFSGRAHGQDHTQHQEPMQGMGDMAMPGSGWHFMQDGLVLGLANHQGGPKGGDEVKVPNWWMGMLTRMTSKGEVTLSGMFSLDAATVGRAGYREIFQAGESLDGAAVVDRQHPHDLFMELAASWRVRVSEKTAVKFSGGPVAEPALGPTAYMHRPSSAGLALTPLGHHTLDATHISFGVVTAAVELPAWVLEGSAFNGREPDDDRWDFDLAKLDSVSGRLTFRPSSEWAIQASIGRLVDAEALHPGNIVRTTASASRTIRAPQRIRSWTIGFGMNAEHEAKRHSVFAEWSTQGRLWTPAARVELVEVDTELLGSSQTAHRAPVVGAVTVGVVRSVIKRWGMEGGIGGNGTVYAVPAALRSSHGVHPASFQLFVRIQRASAPGS